MINRWASQLLGQLGRQFPAVLMLGPRQCGKTTLARSLVGGTYLDLERPSDFSVLSSDPEMALERLPGPLVLDEAHRFPPLFAVLRSVIDADRTRPGRFFLLGSVNPSLVQQVTESLAGRVGMIELTPFLFAEIAELVGSLDTYWLRGGFPEACLEPDTDRRIRWMENYSAALAQRDLAGYGLKLSPPEMSRFLGMLAHVHGGLLNASELGRSLGVSHHTVNGYLDLLEGHYLIRRLPPWHANAGKRLVKSPKVYVRDSGLLHHLLGIRTDEELLRSPKRGASWEGLLIEQIIGRENLEHTGSRFWFYRSRSGAEIDLIVDRGHQRIGYELKCSLSVNRHDASGLRVGLSDGIIDTAMIVHAGDRRYPVAAGIEAVPAKQLIGPGA